MKRVLVVTPQTWLHLKLGCTSSFATCACFCIFISLFVCITVTLRYFHQVNRKCFENDTNMATGGRARLSSLRRSPAPGNRFPPELEWPPRREVSVVTRCRTLAALSTCLLNLSVCWWSCGKRPTACENALF